MISFVFIFNIITSIKKTTWALMSQQRFQVLISNTTKYYIKADWNKSEMVLFITIAKIYKREFTTVFKYFTACMCLFQSYFQYL